MRAERIVFNWRVNPGGYQWLPTDWARARGPIAPASGGLEPEEPASLVESYRSAMVGARRRRYEPLKKYTGLFRTFATTEPTREGMLAFANEYGSLTRRRRVPADLRHDGQPAVLILEDENKVWRDQIRTMRAAVELWDLVTLRDVETLSRRVVWRTDRGSVDYHPGARDVVAERNADADTVPLGFGRRGDTVRERFSSGDYLGAAATYFQSTVDENLAKRSSSRLLPDRKGKRVALHHAPLDLLGAMWLQFALAVAGGKSYSTCKECGRWFEIPSAVEQANKRFCSGSCRSRGHRQRRASAQRLSKEGRSHAEIADELGSDAATVKGGLAES